MARCLVLFDLDGTVVDSFHNIHTAMTRVFSAEGLAGPSRQDMRGVIGLVLPQAVAALLPTMEESKRKRIENAYKEAVFTLRRSSDFCEPLFPGAYDVFQQIQAMGVVLGIATGKGRRSTLDVLEKHGLTDSFVTIQTADDCAGKPAPDMGLRAMKETGIAPDMTMMVGDTTFDMMMARSAGCKAVGVSWGNHASGQLLDAGAHAVIDAFAELIPIVAALIEGEKKSCGSERLSK